jgi:hypothetical protein
MIERERPRGWEVFNIEHVFWSVVWWPNLESTHRRWSLRVLLRLYLYGWNQDNYEMQIGNKFISIFPSKENISKSIYHQYQMKCVPIGKNFGFHHGKECWWLQYFNLTMFIVRKKVGFAWNLVHSHAISIPFIRRRLFRCIWNRWWGSCKFPNKPHEILASI